jgi:hypothetical protein
MVLQKEPCSKLVVIKAKELLLGGENGPNVELGCVQQDYNGQGGEEMSITKVEHLDVELQRRKVEDDSDMELDN